MNRWIWATPLTALLAAAAYLTLWPVPVTARVWAPQTDTGY